MRAAHVIHGAATEEHTRWIGRIDCKYLQLRIDQRTGDFSIRDAEDNIVDNDTLYEMFPELKD